MPCAIVFAAPSVPTTTHVDKSSQDAMNSAAITLPGGYVKSMSRQPQTPNPNSPCSRAKSAARLGLPKARYPAAHVPARQRGVWGGNIKRRLAPQATSRPANCSLFASSCRRSKKIKKGKSNGREAVRSHPPPSGRILPRLRSTSIVGISLVPAAVRSLFSRSLSREELRESTLSASRPAVSTR
jgi:hypothetical protein